ncbi:MAG: hypothetical protein M0Q14_09795 [Tissierellaceae bacterium]|nr:hypothetical protein [Tissierellaceae bacterium]
MKKTLLKPIFAILAVFLVVYLVKANSMDYSDINLSGNNDDWRAYLHINVGHSNELIITPATDKFELPREIVIDIYVKDRSIYSDILTMAKSDNFPEYGTYKYKFDSNKYLVKHHKDIYILITYEDETSRILLTSVSYP